MGNDCHQHHHHYYQHHIRIVIIIDNKIVGRLLPLGFGSKGGTWIDHVDSTAYRIIFIFIIIHARVTVMFELWEIWSDISKRKHKSNNQFSLTLGAQLNAYGICWVIHLLQWITKSYKRQIRTPKALSEVSFNQITSFLVLDFESPSLTCATFHGRTMSSVQWRARCLLSTNFLQNRV